MTYESAPATKLVATNCAICCRPLVDAQSVESGMGPGCRSRYGLQGETLTEAAREEANQLVHAVAIHQDGIEVAQAAKRLRELGCLKLATKIEQRACDVVIWAEAEALAVRTPPVVDLYALAAYWRSIPGRKWDANRRINLVPRDQKRALLRLLKTFYVGKLACGPKGAFKIGS